MREIKFRAYIKTLKWLVPVERINFDCKTIEVDLSDGNGDISEYNFDEMELMQYIGLHDMNGKRIYESDILNLYDTLYLVYWDQEDDCWGLKSKEKDLFLFQVLTCETVIKGNKFENTELLDK